MRFKMKPPMKPKSRNFATVANDVGAGALAAASPRVSVTLQAFRPALFSL